MEQAVAKVIRIELRVGGGGGGQSTEPGNTKTPGKRATPKSKTMSGRLQLSANKLAGAGIITMATQLTSEAFSISETLSYNSEEKTSLMNLDISKKAVSTILVTGGFVLGGPVGAAIGMSINQLLVQPMVKGSEIGIQRGLDQTRATNRFYQTNFAGKGNYVFDYASGSYRNEDLQKIINSSFYKKGSAI